MESRPQLVVLLFVVGSVGRAGSGVVPVRAVVGVVVAVAVVAENTRGPNGVLGSQLEPSHTDDFGHPYYDGPAQYLAGLVSQRLRVRARHEKPGTIQRSMMSSISSVDAEEAELAGRSAAQLALAHHNDEMVALVRDCDEAYSIHMEGVPLSKIAGRV